MRDAGDGVVSPWGRSSAAEGQLPLGFLSTHLERRRSGRSCAASSQRASGRSGRCWTTCRCPGCARWPAYAWSSGGAAAPCRTLILEALASGSPARDGASADPRLLSVAVYRLVFDYAD